MFISFASNSTYITRLVKSLWHQSNRSFSFSSLQIEHNFIVIEHQEISLLKAKRLILRRTQARTQRHGQPAIRRTIPKNEVRPHPVRICPVRVRGRPSASADRSKYFVSKNFQVPSRGCMTESTRKIKEQRFCLPQKTLDAYEMGQLARRQHAHLVHSPHVTLKNSEDFYKFLGWRQVPPPGAPGDPQKCIISK